MSLSNNKLSFVLEDCLLNLLDIKDSPEIIISFEIREKENYYDNIKLLKSQDPVYKIISEYIINTKFLRINRRAIARLQELHQKEESFFSFSYLKKAEFDAVVYHDLVLEEVPDFTLELSKSYGKNYGSFLRGP